MTILHRIRVVLCGTTHPGNIGSAARALKTMGLTQLWVVAPRDPDALSHPDAIALSAGASDVLAAAHVVPSLDEALAGTTWVAGASARSRSVGPPVLAPGDCARAAITELTTAPTGDHLAAASDLPAGDLPAAELPTAELPAAELPTADHANDIALLFGRENSGLMNDELDRCHVHMHIPANPDYSSLNLAMAVQVMVWELREAALGSDQIRVEAPDSAQGPLADDARIQGLIGHLERALMATEFLPPDHAGNVMRRLQRFFNRARPERDEVHLWRGILKALSGAKRPR